MVDYVGKGRAASKTMRANQSPNSPPPQPNTPSANSGNVTVVCRFRPFNEKELEMGSKPIVSFDGNGKSLKLNVQVCYFPVVHPYCNSNCCLGPIICDTEQFQLRQSIRHAIDPEGGLRCRCETNHRLCPRGIQWHDLRLRSNIVRKDPHHAGAKH